MPPPNAALDLTSHRTVRYFPHPTSYQSFKSFILWFCIIIKIIAPSHNFTHIPNKIVRIYTSNHTFDLSPIPLGAIGASILFPPIPLPGFPRATCEDQRCWFEPASDGNLTERSHEELWRLLGTRTVELGRRAEKWYKASGYGGLFSGYLWPLLALLSHFSRGEASFLNSSNASATMETLMSTCQLTRTAYWTYRAEHPISRHGPWAHWLSGKLNDGLHHLHCPYLDYAFIGIVLRDVFAFLASAGYALALAFISLLAVASRLYLPSHAAFEQAFFTQAGRWAPYASFIPRCWAFLSGTCLFIFFSAAYVLTSVHSLITRLCGIPPMLSDIPLSWFGHHYYRHSTSSSPAALCGTLFWLGFVSTWSTTAPIFGLLLSSGISLAKYSFLALEALRRVKYYRSAYTRASNMVGPSYVTRLSQQVLVDVTVLLVYIFIATWFRDVLWVNVVPSWVKYSPTLSILVGYWGFRYALSGRDHTSPRWRFRGLGRREMVDVRVLTLQRGLAEPWGAGGDTT
ncbi:hypothetical protein L873DRAFT_622484 [Choiromyces venosus 120613-1]|uniref:Uncharacterized protein n=1 Tax=Choiromyces venosus 120613-1 TaxID=1336337 RepID=A0A3N4J6S8_9PEZI|nr:hypothetical protein L873DRAFT_622484 [Choiromyces venosus 120613-1]